MASGGKESAKKDDLDVEATIASVRETLNRLDNFENRWKEVQRKFGEVLKVSLQSAYNIESPSSLSDEEKQAVLGGNVTLEEICKRLKEGAYKRVMVMAGAGISVSAGIPDFRSPGTGLYNKIDLVKYNLPYPQAVFEIDYFHKDPTPFFAVAKHLYPDSYNPTPTHYFIKLLAEKELLHRCYTQNIDGLERKAGLNEDLLVEAHGSFSTAKCTNRACGKDANPQKVKEVILKGDGQIPKCSFCGDGVVKPNIVFFREDLPARFKELLEPDCSECDLLIIMGTSLTVQPFNSITHRVKETTPRLLVNREMVGTLKVASEGGYRDVAVLQDCDDAVNKICELCGWSKELFKMLPNQGHRSSATASTSVGKSLSKERTPNSPIKTEPKTSDHSHIRHSK